MTKGTTVVLCITLSLMCCFLTFGYATLTDTLNLTGSAEVEIPLGLYIIKVETYSESNVDVNNVSNVKFATTVASVLSKVYSYSNQSGSVTYEITVLNNTSRE